MWTKSKRILDREIPNLANTSAQTLDGQKLSPAMLSKVTVAIQLPVVIQKLESNKMAYPNLLEFGESSGKKMRKRDFSHPR